jgi:hypothetical protein
MTSKLTTSVLSKFQKKYYNIQIKDHWVEFSIETPEFEILESLVKEEKGELVLPVLQRNGVNPLETSQIDCYEDYKKLETDFWMYVDEIATKTKLTRFEVIYKAPQELDSLIEELQAEAEKLEAIAGDDDLTVKKREKVQADIDSIKEKITERSKEILEKTGDYQADIDKKYADYQAKQYEFQLELAALRSGIPTENIKNLHPEFLAELGAFMNREIRGETSEKK